MYLMGSADDEFMTGTGGVLGPVLQGEGESRSSLFGGVRYRPGRGVGVAADSMLGVHEYILWQG